MAPICERLVGAYLILCFQHVLQVYPCEKTDDKSCASTMSTDAMDSLSIDMERLDTQLRSELSRLDEFAGKTDECPRLAHPF
jgi:hypothetical protein